MTRQWTVEVKLAQTPSKRKGRRGMIELAHFTTFLEGVFYKRNKTYFCREYPEEGCEKCTSIAEARKIFNCDCDGEPCCEGPISLEELKEKTRTRRKRQ